ncbi:hypothetical protein [Streptomyces sp. NPDC057579]|uniref:hypothetical protein n=1 Tax=Streptomyces sp. NPDC057579 TaxID=3346172 RepID=UPI00367D9267
MYEPDDLDYMTRPEALAAVLTDLRAHQVDPGPDGFFTALRHIDLLGHLALRFTADAHHLLSEEIPTTNPAQDALRSSRAAAMIGRALAHYTQALPALTKVSDPASRTTIDAQLEAIPHHSALRRHLDAAQRTLDEARIELTGAVPPLPTRKASADAKPPATPRPLHRRGL